MYYGGQRYYLDNWDSQEWKPFPAKWLTEGNLVRDDGQTSGASAEEIDVKSEFVLSDNNKDDRSGFFHHPKRLHSARMGVQSNNLKSLELTKCFRYIQKAREIDTLGNFNR